MRTLSLLNVISPDEAEQHLRAHGQLPRALLIDTRPTPDVHLRMDWRTQYRHDPRRRLDVAWLESQGYQVLVLTAGERPESSDGPVDAQDSFPDSRGKDNAPARKMPGLPRQREIQGQTSGRVKIT